MPLDGGRFATSDLNDLYRRVIIRNNRLKRLIEIKAPEVILRNEKRMLQEAVDSLLDNSRKSSAVKTDANRPLKSLSDSLKGKQGRFRQNLLGKRVDYSARSVIVVGPELKMHECGIPKYMAAELYKPFIIRKLIERGIVKTVKSAKKIVDRKEPVVWDILENVMKGHPVLLNRAPTLHRLGIQAFQPKMIEGKAIQLHPLACTAFNADFDGDQMAVHLPLGNEAILEAQMLMLGSHNILNPANGAPITVPSQDMVLGLYYITKLRKGSKGEGLKFYGPEEAQIAYNEGRITLHAPISVVVDDIDEEGNPIKHLVENTSVGRVLFNEYVPKEIGYVNELISKKSLRTIIGKVIKRCGIPRSAQFLDDIKNMGYYMAFQRRPVVQPRRRDYSPRKGGYRQRRLRAGGGSDEQLCNGLHHQQRTLQPDYRHLDTRQLPPHRRAHEADDRSRPGLQPRIHDARLRRPWFEGPDPSARRHAWPYGQASESRCRRRSDYRKPDSRQLQGGSERCWSTSSPPTVPVRVWPIPPLKTADAGYLTRRLVDVAHDVIIREEDCGTLRGLVCREIKNNDEVVASLGERILGRVSVHDIIDPATGEIIVKAGEEINDAAADRINASPIESVEIRSVLTCESKHGVCAKCYGRNLATHRPVQIGEAVGVIAAQSIGEPGTQLTLRTFHVGGVASNIAAISTITSRYDGILELEELRTVETDEKTPEGNPVEVVIGRLTEMRIIDPKTRMMLTSANIPYGSKLYFKDGAHIKVGDVVCEWDPFNAVIVSEVGGKIHYENLVENVTYRVEADEQSGLREKIIIESRDRTKVPEAQIVGADGTILKTYALPVNAHLMLEEGQEVKPGEVFVKITRSTGGAGDITGGLPRVTELFEARNPSNPAIVSEIDGEVHFGRVKRGNREISITSKLGEEKKYLVPLSKQILVQENDYVRAGTPLSDGAITPTDILNIMGPTAVQEYIVNEVQDVYRMQGVKINDKHFEVIVRQMMRKVNIIDPGDTCFLEQQVVDKRDFMDENDRIWGKKVVVDAGDSENLHNGQIITARKLRDENSALKRRDLRTVVVRDAVPATSEQILQGITRAALQTSSFMSAASFQETTKVLNEAAINGKTDNLEGMKENVICGHLIPAGTGLRQYERIVVGSKDDIEDVIREADKIQPEAEVIE